MNSEVDRNENVVWYTVEDFWIIQKRHFQGQLLFGLLLGLGSLMVFSIVFHLGPGEFIVLTLLGLLCGYEAERVGGRACPVRAL